MAAATRKTATVLAAPALLVALSGTATAEPVSTADFSNCPANHGCFYTGANGGGVKCRWANNSRHHATDCTAADTGVGSIANRKSSYLCFYQYPYYSKEVPWGWVPPNSDGNLPGNRYVLSHRWVSAPTNC